MPMSLPWIRPVSLAAALLFAAVPALAQGRSNASARVESVVVTAPAVRVRTAPYMSSLSIDEFREGAVFPLASDTYHSQDWLGIMIDGRVAFVPRYAVAARPVAALRAAVETAPVSLAGAPTPVVPAPAAPTVKPAPAAQPVVVAVAPERATPVKAPSVAPAVAPAVVPAVVPAAASAVAPRVAPTPLPTPAPTPTPAAQPKPVPPTPVKAAERVAAQEASTATTPTSGPNSIRPALSAKRAGVRLTLGVLGSVTPVEVSGLTPTAHVSGLSFVGARYRRLGAYFAPELGQGGGYRSTMIGGGASLDLLDLRMLRVSALGGFTTYSETPTAVDTATAPVTRSVRGTSVGGMASIPLVGPLRIAYRGQFVTVRDAGIASHMVRHSVGLIVF